MMKELVLTAPVDVGNRLVKWGGKSASGPGCRLDVGYHRPVCVETDVGPTTTNEGFQRMEYYGLKLFV